MSGNKYYTEYNPLNEEAIYLTTTLNNFYEKFGFEFVEESDVWFENEKIIREKIYKIEKK